MRLENCGLILEGGGLRGVYTSGVLRHLMDQGLYFPYVIGVSMGACNGANYVSRQPERNRIVNIRYVNDRRYLSFRRWLCGGDLFGMPFIFDTIPNRLVPFDRETFMASSQRHITGVTDCTTGEPLYFDQREAGDDLMLLLQASCSLPFAAPPVLWRGRALMDGGIADSVPIRKSLRDGNRKHVLVLTRPHGYVKKDSILLRLAPLWYRPYPGLCRALSRRADRYNRTMALVEDLCRRGSAFVLRPQRPLAARRVDRRKEKLYEAYDQGYQDAAERYDALCEFLK